MKNKGTYWTLSMLSGGLAFTVAYLILKVIGADDAGMLALLSGTLFTGLLFLCLLALGAAEARRYHEAEKLIDSPVLLKINGNFNQGGRVRNGNVYICGAGIVFILLDRKPYAAETLSFEDVEKFEADQIHLNIYTRGKESYLITTPDAQSAVKVLREAGRITAGSKTE